jgi:hypothetical protein
LTLLGSVFRYAMRHEWIETNHAQGARLRASSRRSHDLVEANILAPPEIQALLAATDPRWRVVILTAMLTVAQVETIEDSLVEVGSRA